MSCRQATRAVRAGIEHDSQHGAVVPPLYLSANFTFDGLGGKRRYDYTRSGNPTRDLLGRALADLEGAADSVVTSSGMAAVALVLHLLEPGDLLFAPHDCYGGTFRLLASLARKGRFRVEFLDMTGDGGLAAVLAQYPKLVWIETPSNPLMRITDIAATARAAKSAGALVCVDNTFLSPALQQPLALGADLVVHSTTKYLNGHSDVVGGAVCAADRSLHEELAYWGNCLGLTGAPFDSFLTLRGLRTLHARMKIHEENARAIADWLQAHELVSRVHYPGLAAHPGHAMARRQQRGFGGMLGFELVPIPGLVAGFLDALRCISLAESLGGVESLIAHPATMTHAAMTEEARAGAGITDRLLRLSVGIEDPADLRDDLEQALAAATARHPSSYSISNAAETSRSSSSSVVDS